ncbi:hypothetical protein [Spirochaeta lutea]|uniref:DRTGG domain-containing protein n=1 Tax=Spirochaeta lutea TaxID=1480694 RepID=A0A098R0A3_9SPIO|nr:hypothetical protein [Spirochaeta lutea]KGE73339.1 hypothetical protein DC28_04215 [Spirochaeta lutea]
MTYQTILRSLEAELHNTCTTYQEADITNFVASDLMSDVLVVEDEEFLLITSLSTEQAVRTADIVGARGILLVNGKRPQPGMLTLAKELNKTLITTPYRMFKTCTILGDILAKEGHPVQ